MAEEQTTPRPDTSPPGPPNDPNKPPPAPPREDEQKNVGQGKKYDGGPIPRP